jgi:hypothetical protein
MDQTSHHHFAFCLLILILDHSNHQAPSSTPLPTFFLSTQVNKRKKISSQESSENTGAHHRRANVSGHLSPS